jgi:hypothetical protein
LIEQHKNSVRDIDDIIDRVSEIEETLPMKKQKRNFSGWQLAIVPTDDPRWIDITRQCYEESKISGEIALQMLSVSPTTLAGLAAMLECAADHVDAGYLWPDDLGELEKDNRE